MSLKIHHLNCGTMCPVCARLINGQGGWLAPANLVCHVLLIETAHDGLVLVDTGFGQLDVQDPTRLGRPFLAVSRPKLSLNETAAYQVKQLGFKLEDVRHIIVTHLDLDHAGGLPDFPLAQVHVFQPEFDAAMNPNFRSQSRYLPAQWAHSPRWVKYDSGVGESWFGLDHVQSIEGLEDQILLVPLTGHTRGHCGVAVKSDDGWLLHCGDAYFAHQALTNPAEIPLGLKLFEELLQTDRRARVKNLKQLQILQKNHGHEIQLFCAHDPYELAQF